MSIHVTINDTNPKGNQKLTIYPHHHESRLEITQVIGNPPKKETLAVFWFINVDMKRALQTLNLEEIS